MDSVTQAALGSAVGVVVLGRRVPVWQAALAGAVVGTLPDLDVFLDQGDPVRNMVLHRAETHAFFWQGLASPIIAWLLAFATGTRTHFGRWWLMVVIGLFSHALLDAITVYGTRIALPFSDHPFGLGSLFIIDPLYTLPLLVGLIAALALRHERGRRWNQVGLIASTLYAGWSVAAQAGVTAHVMSHPATEGIARDQVLVTPTPFNTLLWRVVVVEDDHYAEGFFSLLDPIRAPGSGIRFEERARGANLESSTADIEAANMIRGFSKGFYALEDDGNRIWITDLRMGQHPYYVFSFAIAEHHSDPVVAIEPLRRTQRMPLKPGLQWLGRRILGPELPPPRGSRENTQTPSGDST